MPAHGEIEFIDASVFMGMNATEEATRRACKTFFIERFTGEVAMCLEQVGLCDEIVWRHARDVQDDYYPFMDRLHSVMRIKRLPYGEPEVRRALTDEVLSGLPISDRLLLAMVMEARGRLYTTRPRLLERTALPVTAPPGSGGADGLERRFPGDLEDAYAISLRLRVPVHSIFDVQAAGTVATGPGTDPGTDQKEVV